MSYKESISLKIVNNTSLDQKIGLLGGNSNIYANSNNNVLVEWNLSTADYSGNEATLQTTIPITVELQEQNIQGLVNALNTTGKAIFNSSGTTLYATSLTDNSVSSANLIISGNLFEIGTGFGGGNVFALDIQSDGKILVGGDFSVYNGSSAPKIVRLNSNGILDTSFTTGAGFTSAVDVLALDIQSDGKILVGGSFTEYNGTTSNRIIRLNPDGSVDATINIGTGFNGTTRTVTIQSDGKILVGGDFTEYNGTTLNRIVRLNTDGSIDGSFSIGTGFNASTYVVKIQTDGKILVGGGFNLYNGNSSSLFVRINTDGSIDGSFSIGTGFNGTVTNINIQSDGKIIVGGAFSLYNGTTSNRIIRLNTDGSVDGTFNIGTGFSGTTYVATIQTDGKILVGGGFSQYNGNISNFLVRINTDGSVDATFNIGTGFTSLVYGISVLPNSKIIVAGWFSFYNGQNVEEIIRLNSDGTSDTNSTP